MELVRRQAAVLVAEDLDDDRPGAAASSAGVPKPGEGRLCPVHDDNDTRSQRRATVGDVRTVCLVVLALAAVVPAACGGGSEAKAAEPTVVAGFYPLAWAAAQIAGPGTRVVNLTPAGAEPHDLELSPGDVRTVQEADLVAYVGGGFQPALDDAVADREGASLDVLRPGERDPHIWLDPVRFAEAVRDLGRSLRRPAEARKLEETLAEIDTRYRTSLRNCARTTFVTTHSAFGRLAERYGLTQLSLGGSTPEAEPGPRDVERLVAAVEASGAPTVFAEPLVPDDVAATVAREAGVDLSVLDPLEGLSEERLDAGDDYTSVMLGNLDALTKALGCR